MEVFLNFSEVQVYKEKPLFTGLGRVICISVVEIWMMTSDSWVFNQCRGYLERKMAENDEVDNFLLLKGLQLADILD